MEPIIKSLDKELEKIKAEIKPGRKYIVFIPFSKESSSESRRIFFEELKIGDKIVILEFNPEAR